MCKHTLIRAGYLSQPKICNCGECGNLTDIGAGLGLSAYWTMALLGSMLLIILVTMAIRMAGKSWRPGTIVSARLSEAESAALVAALAVASEAHPGDASVASLEWRVSASTAWKEATKLSLTMHRQRE